MSPKKMCMPFTNWEPVEEGSVRVGICGSLAWLLICSICLTLRYMSRNVKPCCLWETGAYLVLDAYFINHFLRFVWLKNYEGYYLLKKIKRLLTFQNLTSQKTPVAEAARVPYIPLPPFMGSEYWPFIIYSSPFLQIIGWATFPHPIPKTQYRSPGRWLILAEARLLH